MYVIVGLKTTFTTSYRRLLSFLPAFSKNSSKNKSLGTYGTTIFHNLHCSSSVTMKKNATGRSGENWMKLAVTRSEIEISTVLACGQSFRWKNDGPDPSEWIGVFAHYLWVLKQTDHCITYKAIGHPRLFEGEYNKILWKYFQLNVSLPQLYKKWAEKDSKFASLTFTDYKGIRMLEQDPVENTFSFICSSNNNISRISQMVEKLCLFYGEPIGELYGKQYYDFPCLEKLCGAEVEKKLREESFGYRAAFIANTASKIVANGGTRWTESLKGLKYDEARRELQALPGIGRKVADCICLMSLGFHDVIPVDTHVHQLGKQYLPHLASIKSLTDKVYSEISEHFRSLFGEYAGWAHSVLFASTLRHLKSDSGEKPKPKSRKKVVVNKSSENGDDSGIGSIVSGVEVVTPSADSSSTVQSNIVVQDQLANKRNASDETCQAYAAGSNNKKRKV